jgi:hypothetical protein
MAFYRSSKKAQYEDQPNLAAVERELERDDRSNLKILVIIAIAVAVSLSLYAMTNNRAVFTDIQPPAPSTAPVKETTTGANVRETTGRTDVRPDARPPEPPLSPKGPQPAD